MTDTCYIAAPYTMRHEAIALMQRLESEHIEVTSRWLTSDDESLCDEWARYDLEDVARANVLLALNLSEWREKGTGGRHVEFGYALALGKKILVVGERTNIFHHLNFVEVADPRDDLAAHIKRLSRAVRIVAIHADEE